MIKAWLLKLGVDLKPTILRILSVIGVPSVSVTTAKIEESPVAVSIGDSSPAFTVPDVPSVSVGTSVT